MSNYSGGCLCGQVHYEIEADPVVGLQCQCVDCRKRSGGGHASFVIFPEAMVKLEGPVKSHDKKADSGNMVTRGFCAECGSPVFNRSSGAPGMIGIMVGSLDNPAQFSPQLVAYASRALPWDLIDPAVQKFPQMPPMA
jgi:hypothetical protein